MDGDAAGVARDARRLWAKCRLPVAPIMVRALYRSLAEAEKYNNTSIENFNQFQRIQEGICLSFAGRSIPS